MIKIYHEKLLNHKARKSIDPYKMEKYHKFTLVSTDKEKKKESILRCLQLSLSDLTIRYAYNDQYTYLHICGNSMRKYDTL